MKKIILTLLCMSLGSLQAAQQSEHLAQIHTTLLMAAERGDLGIIKSLITTPDININHQDMYGRTALIIATTCRHTAILQALINAPNIDLNIQDKVD